MHDELGLSILESHWASGDVSKLILVTNPTVKGNAIAHFITDMTRSHEVSARLITHIVPFGG